MLFCMNLTSYSGVPALPEGFFLLHFHFTVTKAIKNRLMEARREGTITSPPHVNKFHSESVFVSQFVH